MSRPVLACASACALVAAVFVAESRVGLAVSVALLLALATAIAATRSEITAPAAVDSDLARSGSSSRDREDPDLAAWRWVVPGALGVLLAVQPLLRDAGAVAAVGVAGALAAAAWVAVPLTGWRALARAVVAPARVEAGLLLVGRTLAPAGRRLPVGAVAPAARAAVAAGCVGGVFLLLLGMADQAFADLAGDVLSSRPDLDALPARALHGVAALGVAGALAFAALRPRVAETPGAVPARAETTAAVAAVTVVFAAFVAVQLRVLFGGAGYVRETTGLGYGEYARSGFVALLLATALTLVVIAVAARRRDRVVRGLLGILCLLDLVVLASAAHRLGLVVDAYGLTRVRVGGFAVVAWLAATMLVVLAAGAVRRVTAHAPRALAGVTLLVALGFCAANPDARIATAALDREEPDLVYVAGLSADALPAVEAAVRDAPSGTLTSTADVLRARLDRPDGASGFNLARSAAR